MKRSAHAKRMARRHQRNQVAKLNLVSLMDIFTILVFFLLLNSGDVEILQVSQDQTLPDSTAQQKPTVALVLMITPDHLVLGDESIVLDDDTARVKSQLKAVLEQASAKRSLFSDELPEAGLPITLMGDKSVSYQVLNLVMEVCAQTAYRDIALAVNQVPMAAGEVTSG